MESTLVLTMSPCSEMATEFLAICSVLEDTLVVSWTMASVTGRSCAASIVAIYEATQLPSQV